MIAMAPSNLRRVSALVRCASGTTTTRRSTRHHDLLFLLHRCHRRCQRVTTTTTSFRGMTIGDDHNNRVPPKDIEEKKKRTQFLALEDRLKSQLRPEMLDKKALAIDAAHRDAISRWDLTYRDPETGFSVMTRWSHFLRGECCGNACRHCVYKHAKVSRERRARRRFNSSFWEEGEDSTTMATGEELYTCTPEDLDRFMTAAVALVNEVGEMITSAIGKQKSVDLKDEDCAEGNASSVLTETDTAVEKRLVEGLSALFPDHEFIGEESMVGDTVEKFSNRPTWIIDPIDGTMNFIHQNPLVCTSIGLAVNRRIVLGIVNNPVTGQMYTAIKGKGAFLNGKGPLKTSRCNALGKAMVLMELPAGANESKRVVASQNVATFMAKAHAVRCPGPAALDIAWVAAGSADGFFHHGIHCWDMAAGALIVVEAGGTILGREGQEFDLMGRYIICAATRELALEISTNLVIYDAKERDFFEPCPI